jgi:hypothetical protein
MISFGASEAAAAPPSPPPRALLLVLLLLAGSCARGAAAGAFVLGGAASPWAIRSSPAGGGASAPLRPRCPPRAALPSAGGFFFFGGEGIPHEDACPYEYGECGGGDDDDLERARRSLEGLFAAGREEEGEGAEEEEKGSRVASAAERYRRQLELELLGRLASSDGAADELARLWAYSTTAENGRLLEAMSESCTPGMAAERRRLERMVRDHPRWAEPRARLAVLLFYKGLTDESYGEAVRAYRTQPYHFELVPILVMNCLRRGDLAQAVRWARKGLPTLRGTAKSRERRSRWVRAAVELVRAEIRREEQADERRRLRLEQRCGSRGPDPPSGGGGSEEPSSSTPSAAPSSVWQ